jgi:hypothetical protein
MTELVREAGLVREHIYQAAAQDDCVAQREGFHR